MSEADDSDDSTLATTIGDVHRELWATVANDLGGDGMGDNADSLDRRVRSLVAAIEPLAGLDRIENIVSEVIARVNGLGQLHELSLDDAVSEIMVNGDGSVWVERHGSLEETSLRLGPDESEHLVRRLAARVGRRIDQTSPSVDVRLEDGSRLHAIIPPLAIDGPTITIRRFAARTVGLDELADGETAAILRRAVVDSRTIVVAGGTSSGKTTLLNSLGALLDPEARIITIEDAAELRLPGRHVVRLETRAAAEGLAAVDLRELVRHALRMRPDRIICGEMRGAEALDLIQAMNTGHRGSLSTVHANNPLAALRRIETMMLMGDIGLPLEAIREQIASCVDLVVMMHRRPDGRRMVTSVVEVSDDVSCGWRLDAASELVGVSDGEGCVS